jgi:hypothetical protein
MSDSTNTPRKQCTGPCEQFLPITSEFFYVHKRDGFSTRCKECTKAGMKAKYKPHPETDEHIQERKKRQSESARNSEKAQLVRKQLAESRRGKPSKPFANPELHSANLSKALKGKKHNIKPRVHFKYQQVEASPIQVDLPVFDGCEPRDNTDIGEVMSIYAIINIVTGKMYIGGAVDTKRRWYIHRWDLQRGAHHSPHLQRAWEKHGAGAFSFRILEVVKDAAILTIREQYWIDHYDTANYEIGYNISHTATRRPSNYRFYREQK